MQIYRNKEKPAFAFLQGGGEMGERVRSFDWSQTSLGTPDQWPQSLRTSVSILLNSQFPMFVWWGKELTTIYNDSYRVIAGDKHPQLLGKSGREGWAEIWEDLAPLVKEVFSGGSTWSEDMVLHMKRHGFVEETYFTFSYSPIMDESGDVGGLFCACIETTEKVIGKKKLQESEQNLRNTILQAPVAMCILRGPAQVVEIANDKMFELWGKEREALLHKPIFEGLPEVRAQGYEELLNKVYTKGDEVVAYAAPVKLPRNGGIEMVYVNFIYAPFREGDGTITGVMVVATDVTPHFLATRKIEEAEQRARLAIESSELGTYEVNLLTSETVTSPRMGAIFDVDDLSDRGRYITALHPEDLKVREEAYQKAYESGNLDYDGRVVRKDGSVRWVRVKGKIYYDYEKTPVRLLGVVQDITELKEFEAQLNRQVKERTQELANANNELKRSNQNLEEFAYAASHDMKEPIRKIHFFSDRLKSVLGKSLNQEQAGYFERMESAARRMSTLIDDLLLYSHVSRGAMTDKNVDLNDVVALVLEDLELETAEKGANITVHPLPVIKGHKRQLQQLFQNLVGNSLKYSKPGVPPAIHISCSEVNGTDATSHPAGESEAQHFYLIEVRDNGIGFEQGDAERIFNVFTRLHGNAEYRGTGVGLSIVRKVVENHHGKIEAESTPGEGATFRVYLPAR